MKKQENEFQTTHKLDFQIAPFSSPIAEKQGLQRFKVGSVIGIFGVTHDGYEIHSCNNTEINNGNFEDVMEWFEYSAKRDKGSLTFTDVKNKRFRKHLLKKRGFKVSEENKTDIVKQF
jgi:hypothetical protein